VVTRTVGSVLFRRRTPGEVLRQLYQIGNRSLLFVCVTLGFIGMVLVFQTCLQVNRITGDLSQVGGEFIRILVHEFGPSLTAMMLATRVGAGIAAEIGSMKVTEQIDALRTLGVNYIKRLVVPRVLAALVVFPLLTVLADAVGVLGGMLIMFLERGADMYGYWNVTTYWVVPKDFLTGVGKSVFFGVIVTLIGCYNGLSTEGGTEGLGRATTATVVHVTMGVIVSDFFITKLFLTLFY
jgi:phospholipid/cholesterol/gamma-HCH transport system permease protein